MAKDISEYQMASRTRVADLIEFRVKKGMRDQLKQIASEKGHKSLSAYIKYLIEQDNKLKL